MRIKKENSMFLVLLGLLVSAESYASRANVLLYGTGDAGGIVAPNGNGGTLWADDAYNIFYNPAYVNEFHNWAVIEKSNRADFVDVGNTAMGGVVGSHKNWSFGAFFNRVGALSGSYTRPTRTAMRPIDVVFGADHGVARWGAGFTFGNFKVSDTVDSSKDLVLRVGVQWMGFEPFLNAKLIGKDTVNGGIENSDFGFGARYRWGNWRPYAAYRSADTASITTAENFGIGTGYSVKAADRITLGGSASIWRLLSVADKRTAIPLDAVVDVNVTQWLALRGGLTYRLLSRTQNGSDADSTASRVGAKIKAGPAEIDWLIGTSNPVGVQDEGISASADSQVLGVGQGFFTATSVAIRW